LLQFDERFVVPSCKVKGGAEEYRQNFGRKLAVAPVDFPDGVLTNGLPALVLIFHQHNVGNFEMVYEGLGRWNGTPAWQVHYLILLEHAEVLQHLYGCVIIPEAVVHELQAQRTPAVVRQWITTPPEWLQMRQIVVPADPALAELDPGESEELLFIAHVAAPEGSWLRRVQNLLTPLWKQLGDGCHPNHETSVALESAGFDSVDYERVIAPTLIVSPQIVGIATKAALGSNMGCAGALAGCSS